MLRNAVVALGIMLCNAAWAQAPYQAPRTPGGQPDLHGVWAMSFLTNLERSDGVDKLVVNGDEAKALAAQLIAAQYEVDDPEIKFTAIGNLAKVRGEYRTSLVVEPKDGRMPLTEAALALSGKVDERFAGAYDNPEERMVEERCLAGSSRAPYTVLPVFLPRRITQTPDFIVIMGEDIDGPRFIHLADDAPKTIFPSHEGWSRGRWEGDTLVVETTHFRADDPVRAGYAGRAVVVGPDSRIIERFTRIGDKELLYQFTVEDKALYSAPWLAEYSLELTDKPAYEYSCHGNNYSLPGILLGGRAEQAREAAKAAAAAKAKAKGKAKAKP